MAEGGARMTIRREDLDGWNWKECVALLVTEHNRLEARVSELLPAQLAAAAPDMARVLLAIEFRPTCPMCGGRVYRDGQPPTHEQDCFLDAALRKAGLR